MVKMLTIIVSIELGEKQILFARQDKRNTLRNYLCIIAKYYIYVTKFTQNRLLLENCINLLKKKFQSEKYIALTSNSITGCFFFFFLLNGHLCIIILILTRGSKFIHVMNYCISK